MIDITILAALVVLAGAVVAVTDRDGRVVVLGLTVAVVVAPLVGPLPSSLSMAARTIGAVMAAYLLWTVARHGPVRSAGSAIGITAEGVAALAAFVVGWWLAPIDPLLGPSAAQGAGFSLIVLAILPMTGRDILRVGVGVTLLALGGSLLLAAWAGAASPLAHFTMAILLVAIAGAVAVLIGYLPEPPAEEEVEEAPEESAADAPAASAESVAAETKPARGRRSRRAQTSTPAVPSDPPPDTSPNTPVASSESPSWRRRLPFRRSRR